MAQSMTVRIVGINGALEETVCVEMASFAIALNKF